MKLYVDTSVLVRAYYREKGSELAQRALEGSTPALSSLTRVEFASAVSKKLRMREFERHTAIRIFSKFRDHIRQGVFEWISTSEACYELASEWIESLATNLRAVDALHLALAYRNRLEIVTADQAMAASGEVLGVDVRLLE